MKADCEPSDLETAIQIQAVMTRRLDIEEVKTLCFRLGVDFDSLRGEGLEGKTRELVIFFQKRQKLAHLQTAIRSYRPDIDI